MFNHRFYQELAKGNIQAFENYFDSFYSNTYIATARLSGITDEIILTALTEETFLYLWSNKHLFAQTDNAGALLFRATLTSVLFYLAKNDIVDRIYYLQRIIHCQEPFLTFNNIYNG